ncbi:MAG: hypothetical protein QM751_13040 [Paludibacteraceae bacterium]
MNKTLLKNKMSEEKRPFEEENKPLRAFLLSVEANSLDDYREIQRKIINRCEITAQIFTNWKNGYSRIAKLAKPILNSIAAEYYQCDFENLNQKTKMSKKNYLTITSPTDDEIRFDFRQSRQLLLFCNFNPIRKIQFVDALDSAYQVTQVSNVSMYEDGTGSMILLLNDDYDRETVISTISEIFENHFNKIQNGSEV